MVSCIATHAGFPLWVPPCGSDGGSSISKSSEYAARIAFRDFSPVRSLSTSASCMIFWTVCMLRDTTVASVLLEGVEDDLAVLQEHLDLGDLRVAEVQELDGRERHHLAGGIGSPLHLGVEDDEVALGNVPYVLD